MNRLYKILSFLIILTLLFSCSNNNNYHKQYLTFNDKLDSSQKVLLSSNVIPSDKQYNWQKLETTIFFHFGINTFANVEWGSGKQSPEIFNPTNLNTDQWVKTIKDAGFKLVILTAKHHDGFCLWQTKTTNYSVANSPWKDGAGDVVENLKKSCDKYDIKFGIYLSPWDRNSPLYGTPEYNDFFVAQLTELLTNYGKIDEIWFDGACGEGPNGKVQEYDFERYYDVINTLMPNAVVAITGEDIRWVGNEKGLGRDTEWSVTPLQNNATAVGKAINEELGITELSQNLGSRELISKSNKVHWWPSEVDVSIRPSWFYHPEEDSLVKSVSQLIDIYFNSVGKNSVLLLNIPPDKTGNINKIDSITLVNFKSKLDQLFSNNLVVSTNEDKDDAIININLKDKSEVSIIELSEDILKGQHIEAFEVLALVDNKYNTICKGTTIGYKRLLRLGTPIQTNNLKLKVLSSRGDYFIKDIKAF